ncbi:alpha/beta fold hydrolase [Phycobacter azelaicus]|uniref:alpha/beta fold hydrolase n=1 Tax=Phycobacter azelaicus TaxID=2668075 RepID=UPI001D00EE9A|nr:alpha/beta hydrolase [Phycobacter azelaicus]
MTALQNHRRQSRARQSHPPEGQFLQVAGRRIHAVEMGQPAGSAPDVVLIHGSNGSTRDMSFRLAPALADRYRVLMLDRPGLGYSDPIAKTPASLRNQASYLCTAAQMIGVERPIVLGQSYGGGVALAWALQHPDSLSALVSVSGVSHPWDGSLDLFYRLTASWPGQYLLVPMITAFVPDQTIRRSLVDVFAPQPVPEGYVDHLGIGLTLRSGSLRANARQLAQLFEDIKRQSQHYGRITAPAELIHGAADTTVGLKIHAEKLAADLPNANLTVLPGVGHMPHHVATDEVVGAVDRAAIRAGLM